MQERSAEQVRVRVIDNGCGIPADDQKRIFDPFFSGRQGGTGLGLFLSLNFVRRWGGEIRVESAVGRGSTFEVVLPALGADVKNTASHSAGGRRFGIPARDGGRTAAAGSRGGDGAIGRRGGARLEQWEPEIVLLDLRLPGMDGLETLKAIRGRNAAIEVIMLTGHGSIDSAIESIRDGAFDYVTKPCPLDEIQIRVQRAIERRALKQRTSLLERALTPADPTASFVGESPEFRRMLHLVDWWGRAIRRC